MSDQNTPDQYPVEPNDRSMAEPDANQRPSRFVRMRERAGGLARGTSRGTAIGLVVGLVIGGIGGFAVAAVASGPDHDERGGQHGRPFEDGHEDGQGDGERGGPLDLNG